MGRARTIGVTSSLLGAGLLLADCQGLPGITSLPSGSTGSGSSSALAAGGGALPTVTPIPADAGEHGYPFDAVPTTPLYPGAPTIDLAADGYVQKEFLLSGTDDVYGRSGAWASNGDWQVPVAEANVLYTTRFLVRYPTNPAKFKWTVVVEWLNDSTGADVDPVWAEDASELLADGYAYVGVTAQRAGMEDLKTWDPERYGSLGDQSDGQSYGIFTQAAEAIRADAATILGGLDPKDLIAAGDSQSAFRLTTYVNAFEPLTHAYDGFLLVGRSVTAAPLGSGLLSTSPAPASIRSNPGAPVLEVNTQGDVEEFGASLALQPATNELRIWEVAGASHIDDHEASYELETLAREEPSVPAPSCLLGTPIGGVSPLVNGLNQADNMPLYQAEQAALADLQRWVTSGVPAPAEQSPLSTTSVLGGAVQVVNTNQFGLASGGVELPQAQVPTEYSSPINVSTLDLEDLSPLTLFQDLTAELDFFTEGALPITDTAARNEGLCLLSGSFLPLPAAELAQLYPTHPDYVAKVTAAAEADEAEGFLTPTDAAQDIAAAQASSIP
jgi:hypothetical protein